MKTTKTSDAIKYSDTIHWLWLFTKTKLNNICKFQLMCKQNIFDFFQFTVWASKFLTVTRPSLHQPSKRSSWWRRLEDVLKTSFVFVFRRRLQDVLIKTNMFALALRLQKTSSRRLGQDQYIRLGYTSSRRLQDVLQKGLQDIFKTSSRRLQDALKNVFKTSSRRIIKLNCSC